MKKRQGSTLIMVIITMIVSTMFLLIVLNIQQSGAAQTNFVAQHNKARYAAMSGSQIVIGALYKRQKTNDDKSPIISELHTFFTQQANSGVARDTRIETDVTIADGVQARIVMVGKFEGDRVAENYVITIRSVVPMPQSAQKMVHETKINLTNPAVKSERIFME